MLALSAACCYSLSTVVLKQGLASVDLLVANLIRMSTAATILLGLETYHYRGKAPAGISRRSLVTLGLAGTLSAASSMMFLTAVFYAGAAKASVLTATSPLFGLPLSILFLREKITRRIMVGTLLAVSGIWLVLSG
jgi:uncharacterized membrane protein